MNNGFIKIHRKLLEWEWYDDIITFKVFIHCLFKANWKDAKFRGYDIPRGSFVTSIKKLSDELSGDGDENKISIQNIRTALNHLKSTCELTIKTTSKFSIITVNNYDLYQDPNTQPNKQLTSNQQTTNKQLTTIEEYKEYKKEINNNNIVEQVINYMNELAGTSFLPSTKKTNELINARLKEGFTLEDFKDVIFFKYNEWYVEDKKWEDDKHSRDYYRPTTLFSNKFETYLQKYKREIKEEENG